MKTQRLNGQLNPAQLSLIRENVLAGLTDSAIAGNLGVSVARFRRWKSLGENPDPNVSYPYEELAITYNAAKSALQRDLMGNVIRASKRDWKAAQWLLERHYPDDLDLNLNVAIENRLTLIIDRVQAFMSPESFDQFLNAINAVQGIESGEIAPTIKTEDSSSITVEAITS